MRKRNRRHNSRTNIRRSLTREKRIKNTYKQSKVLKEMLSCAEEMGKDEGRAETIKKVSELISKRFQMGYDKASCDDCTECCEVSALKWVERRLKERKNDH